MPISTQNSVTTINITNTSYNVNSSSWFQATESERNKFFLNSTTVTITTITRFLNTNQVFPFICRDNKQMNWTNTITIIATINLTSTFINGVTATIASCTVVGPESPKKKPYLPELLIDEVTLGREVDDVAWQLTRQEHIIISRRFHVENIPSPEGQYRRQKPYHGKLETKKKKM